MKLRGLVWVLLLGGIGRLNAQAPLTLEEACDKALSNYPAIQKLDLLKQTEAISIENISKGFLPQLSISGQASYQSDVTQIKIPVPGISIPSLSKDQYRLLADLNQLIFDGGASKARKQLQSGIRDVSEKQVATELYQLKERINQIYLGILYTDAQLKQLQLLFKDIDTGIQRVQAQVNNGVAFRSNLDLLKAERLKNEQREIELKASRKGLVDVLALFMNDSLSANQPLQLPVLSNPLQYDSIQRPELAVFNGQTKLNDIRLRQLRSGLLPKASLFAQGGYGRPGLDLLRNDFSFYYIAGLRLNWSIGNFYTYQGEKDLLRIDKRNIDVTRQTFLLNSKASLRQQAAEISKWQSLINSDYAIITLRERIKLAAAAQLENGVITANDYLREVNAEDQARQALFTHQLLLLQAQLTYQTISGHQ